MLSDYETSKLEFGDLADCHRGEHAEPLEHEGELYCPRCGILVVTREEKTS
jgi:hypothetical protein